MIGNALLGDADELGLVEAEGEILAEADADGLDDGDSEGDGLRLEDGEALALGLRDGLSLGLTEALGLTLALGDIDGDSLALGESDDDGLTLKLDARVDSHTFTPFVASLTIAKVCTQNSYVPAINAGHTNCALLFVSGLSRIGVRDCVPPGGVT